MIGNFPPPFGGVPCHVEQVSAYLAGRGWDVHVLSGGTSGTERRDGVTIYKPSYGRKLLAWARARNRRRFDAWAHGGSFKRERRAEWRRYTIYAELARRIVERHGIGLVASYNALSYGVVGSALAEEYGLPHVMTVFGELYKNEPLCRRNIEFLKEVFGRASTVLSCSNHCAASVARLGINVPVSAMTYGIDVDHFAKAGNSAADSKAAFLRDLREGTTKLAVFVGRIDAEMGVDVFLAAARMLIDELPELGFIVAGQRGNEYSDVEAFCRQFKGRAVMLADVPYEDLPKVYRAADVVAVPTVGDRTCSSLAAMEAMAAGKPVVASAIGGIPEIIDDGRTGVLVPAADAPALRDALRKVLSNADFADKIGREGEAEAKRRFGHTRVNAETERVFARMLSNA